MRSGYCNLFQGERENEIRAISLKNERYLNDADIISGLQALNSRYSTYRVFIRK